MKPVIALAILLFATAGIVQATPATSSAAVNGEVLEVRDVDSYTYLRLKTKDGEQWAAVSTTPIKPGAQVSIGNPMVMENFESKSLKRKFDRIVFGTVVGPNAGPSAPASAPHGAVPVASLPVAKIAKAAGPEGRTVAEIVAGKGALKDKSVLVRGQVVKVTSGVLGKNWVHVQDGSGSREKGTNDILVTTQDRAAVGDVVTAKGTVRTDVDLGSGYKYAVLIDGAALQK